MSSYSRIFAVNVDGLEFGVLREELSRRIDSEKKSSYGDLAALIQMEAAVMGASDLPSLAAALDEGTLVYHAGIWLLRESRYANDNVWDPGVLLGDALHGRLHLLTRVMY
jgi:hypothetical protein